VAKCVNLISLNLNLYNNIIGENGVNYLGGGIS